MTVEVSNESVAESIERLYEPRRGLFRVRRTSDWNGKGPPCDGAKLYRIIDVDVRTVDDPKKIPAHRGTDGDWYQRGENHRVVNGCIARDVGWQQAWFVEIPDVMEFARKHGRCIVEVDRDGHDCIEIYDWCE